MGRRVRNQPKKRSLSASPFRCVLNSMKAAARGQHPLPLQAANLRSADLLSCAQRLRGRRHVCQQPIYGCGAAPPRAQASARSMRRARANADRASATSRTLAEDFGDDFRFAMPRVVG